MSDNHDHIPVTPGYHSPHEGETDPQKKDEIMMEQFAHLYAMGVPPPEALVEAGYGSRSNTLAWRLLHHPRVIELVDEARKYRNEKLSLKIDDVLSMLQRDRDFAYKMSNSAGAIQASSMIGKILGALDPNQKVPVRITMEWGAPEPEE